MSIVRRSAVAAMVATLAAPGGWLLAARASAVTPVTFVVNSTADRAEAGPAGVCQTSVAGECTLRAAITEADQAAGPVTIQFNIPGSGVQTIAPQTPLPGLNNLSYPITIDGFTQPGSSVNTDPLADNAVRLIELVGQGPSVNGFKGLQLLSAKNVVRGIDIHGFYVQILMSGTASHKNVLEGDLIGLKPDGSYDPGWTGTRVKSADCVVVIGSNANQIGLPGNANRNVISGCYNSGISFNNAHTGNNVVQNNIIGLDPTGTQRRANQSMGVDHDWGVTGTLVGGTGTQQGNVISGNLIDGVQISHGTGNNYNKVIGNFIGTNPAGNAVSAATVNSGHGVYLEGRPFCTTKPPCPPDEGFETVTNNVIVNSGIGGVQVDKGNHDDIVANNLIGILPNGTLVGNGSSGFGVEIAAGATHITIGPGNVIAGNQRGIIGTPDSVSPVGTTEYPTEYNTITQNSIHDNTSTFGIDWLPYNQVNQSNDGDPNFNEGINVPILTASPGQVTAQTCSNCTVELFASNQAVGTYGSGITFIASAAANGTGIVIFTTPAAGWPAVLTATATMTDGSSSEFAQAISAPTS